MDLALSILAFGGVLSTGYLAVIFWRNPEDGMAKVHHRGEALPTIMTGRYLSYFLLAVGAFWSGDPAIIAVLFAVFAFVSAFDTWVYLSRGQTYMPHALAGVGSLIVMGAALLALGGA